MKLGLAMENGKPEIVTVTGLPDKVHQDQPSKSTTKRLVVGVVVGVFALAVVAAIVLVSVFFGSKISADNYKLARQTFKTDDGKIVEEETNITDNEVDIRIPNIVEIVYDYKHGLVVRRFVDSQTKVRSACFAHFINETIVPSTNKDMYQEGEHLLRKSDDEVKEEQGTGRWRSTERVVPKYLISETVAKMCEGTKVFWMEKTQDPVISKRDCDLNTCLAFTLYYTTANPCTYIYRTYTFCKYASGWTQTAYSTGYYNAC